MTSADEIAKAFRESIAEGALTDPATYYAVQRGCTVLLETASSLPKVALFCAAALAERLAREVEDGAISAEAEGNWHAYADALERTIKLADSGLHAQEFMWTLANAVATIVPPRGRP